MKPKSLTWWYLPLNLALGSQNQSDLCACGQPDLHGKFQGKSRFKTL